jgi:hypothetical protein
MIQIMVAAKLNAEADKLLEHLFIKRDHQISSFYLLRLFESACRTTSTVSQVQCYYFVE